MFCAQHIIKFKSLIKEGIGIYNRDVKMINDQKIILNKLLDKLQCSSLNNVSLSEDSGEVAFHISGYIAKKKFKKIW